MSINPSYSRPKEMLLVDKLQDLLMAGHDRMRQLAQEAQYLRPVFEGPTGKLSNDEGVNEYFIVIEESPEQGVAPGKVLNPYGGIDESHATLVERLLGIGESFFSVPPSSANRRALSFAMRASSPIRTRAVFWDTPVSFAASRTRASSMLSVVRICIMMSNIYISVKMSCFSFSTTYSPKLSLYSALSLGTFLEDRYFQYTFYAVGQVG